MARRLDHHPPRAAARPGPHPGGTAGRTGAGALRASSVLASVGEGLVAVALPLVTAGVTRDPLAVASVVAAAHLPWVVVLVLGPGAIRGRDRRSVLGLAGSLRAAAVVAVAWTVLRDTETLLLLQSAALVGGLGEALADHVEESAEPPPTGGRTTAPAPLRPGGLIGLAAIGLPVGGALYEALAAVPFLVAVLVFAVASLCALLMPTGGADLRVPGRGARRPVPALVPGTTRPTAVAAAASAATSAVLGVLVLFAVDDLGLGAPAFGILLLALAVGATGGGVLAPELARRRGPATAVLLAAAVGAVAYALAAVVAAPSFPLAGALLLVLGSAGAMATGVLARADLHARGGRRLGSEGLRAFHLVVWAAVPVGALVGGLLGTLLGVAPAVALGGALPLVAAALLTRRTTASPGSGREAGRRRPPARPLASTIRLTGAPERGAMPRGAHVPTGGGGAR